VFGVKGLKNYSSVDNDLFIIMSKVFILVIL
jgi:hypothetical protein